MNQKSYLQERSQRLHFEILDELDNKASVEKKASELLTLLEEHCARDYSSILEKHGRQKLQNEVLTSPLSSIDLDLALFSGDGIFLYQIFTLLNNESCRKKAEALAKKEYENMISCYKYILEGFPGGGDEIAARLNMAEYLYSADIKDCALAALSPYFEEGGFKQTIYPRKALFDYCFLSTKEYDDKLDREIINIFKAYLSCNRDPRDLFHTDHTYIKDHLAKDPWDVVEDVDYWKAESLLKSVRLRYILRDIYPKPSFGGMEKSNYNVQNILFDRVLFNEVILFDRVLFNEVLNLRPPSTPHPKYWEPEMLLDFYLQDIIPSRALVKSEWIGLYLASKEIELDRFQHLFRTIGPRERDYKKSTLKAFYAHTFERIQTEAKLEEFREELNSVDRNLNNAPPSLGRAQKRLFKGLLFMSMWEKSSYSPISQKVLDELSNGDYASPEEGMKALYDYYNKTKLHSLFMDSPIENLCPVLKEASKLLKMSEEGFDYNYYSLEGDTGGAEDFITLLHSYSRIERESKPALISVLNLLRQRQLEYMPIIKDHKVDEVNLKKTQEIDGGFKLDHFQSTLYPLYELPSLQKSDLNNQYIYSSKTVKFICESDRVYTGPQKNDVDWLESNRKALHTVYLYKIRNQASHFAEDENIPVSMEPKHLSSLIPILIESCHTYEKYTEDIYFGWEREGLAKRMLASRPFRLIPPLYLRNHLCLLIKVLCLIAEEKGHPEIASLAMGEGFDKLEAYLKNQDKPTEFSSYKLTEEERSSILAKLKWADGFCSPSFRAQDKPFDLAEHYLTYFEEILRDTLRFLFSSEVQNYYERTQENSFLKTYHAESAFYMLHLAPALFNNPNITQSKE